METPIYKLTLGQTYYQKGFFNLGVEVARLIRPDNGPIQILLGEERKEITARVDRNANQNGTPRIHAGKMLSDWFQQNFQPGIELDVVILSKEELWITKTVNGGDTPLTSKPAIPKLTNQPKINGSHNFQRIGAVSNAHAGNDFELQAQRYFASEGIDLSRNHSVPIGVATAKKPHRFDLASDALKIILECKSHTWTNSGNSPSAKLSVWNEVMFYFMLAPAEYRKILFVLKSNSPKYKETLACYYIRTYKHLIPSGVEIWEYDPETGKALNVTI